MSHPDFRATQVAMIAVKKLPKSSSWSYFTLSMSLQDEGWQSGGYNRGSTLCLHPS